MSNIELLSIEKLKSRLANTKHLIPQINDNDKEPSWDGHIRIYGDISDKTHEHKKDKLIGRIPVQVKGKEIDSSPVSKSTTKFPVEIADLRNYFNDGGALYFVIEVFMKETDDADDFDYQIFYNSLTPEIISKILEAHDTQKTYCINLNSFPKNKFKIETIIRTSYERCRRQHSSMGKCISPVQIDLKNDRMHIPLFEYDKTKIFLETMFENGIHAYCIKPGGINLPLFNFDNVTSIETKSAACVCFSNRSIELESSSSKTQTDCKTSIGGILTIHKCPEKLEFNFHESERYYEDIFYTDMLLYLNDADDKKILLNGAEVNVGSDFFDTINMDYVKQYNAELYSIKNYLDALNSNFDFIITYKNQKDIHLSKMIYECSHLNKYLQKQDILIFIDTELISTLKDREIKFIEQNFLNQKLLVCITKYGEDKYAIIDPFVICHGLLHTDQNELITIYDEIVKVDYCETCNIDFNLLPNCYNEIKSNPSSTNLATNTLLNILGAYDLIYRQYALGLEREKYSKKLLSAASELSHWIVKNNSDEKFSTKANINMLQTIRRERPFNEDELEQIKDMIDDKANGNDEKFALYLLLNDQKHAQRLFATLKQEEQEFYKAMPIYHFAHFEKSEQDQVSPNKNNELDSSALPVTSNQ